MYFNRKFVEIFEKVLIQDGYLYCSKLRRFIKVINNEIVCSVGYKSVSPTNKGYQCFTITAGIRTVYFEGFDRFNFECTERELQMFSPHLNYGMGFEYDKTNIDDMLKKAVELVEELIIPVLNCVIDMESYIKYAKRFAISSLQDCDRFKKDSLVLILTDNKDSFDDILSNDSNSISELEKNCVQEYLIEPRDKVYKNKELYDNAVQEAKRRKEKNLKVLRSCKVLV